jgi:hypothetical protein
LVPSANDREFWRSTDYESANWTALSCDELSVVGSEPTTPRVAGSWAISPMITIVGTAWLVVYTDAADSMCPTLKDKLNEELLAFFKVLTRERWVRSRLSGDTITNNGTALPDCYVTWEQGNVRIFRENRSLKEAFFSSQIEQTPQQNASPVRILQVTDR